MIKYSHGVSLMGAGVGHIAHSVLRPGSVFWDSS